MNYLITYYDYENECYIVEEFYAGDNGDLANKLYDIEANIESITVKGCYWGGIKMIEKFITHIQTEDYYDENFEDE